MLKKYIVILYWKGKNTAKKCFWQDLKKGNNHLWRMCCYGEMCLTDGQTLSTFSGQCHSWITVDKSDLRGWGWNIYANVISMYEEMSKIVMSTLIVLKIFPCLSSGIFFWMQSVFVSWLILNKIKVEKIIKRIGITVSLLH